MTRFQKYVLTWTLICVWLAYEYFTLIKIPDLSLLNHLAHEFKFGINDKTPTLSIQAGRPLSLALGWSGFGIMLVTNFYIFRKRIGLMKNWGKLPGWLDFHIFCGMLGPAFIVFHTGFKVRGLVSISFWSMVIVATSGVIGRYLYVQILKKRSDLQNEAAESEGAIRERLSKDADTAMSSALIFVGAGNATHSQVTLAVLFKSLIGDFKLAIGSLPPLGIAAPKGTRLLLAKYAVKKRQILFFDFYQKLLGYWHSFHLPFAFFMYLVAVIHIAAALLLGVNR